MNVVNWQSTWPRRAGNYYRDWTRFEKDLDALLDSLDINDRRQLEQSLLEKPFRKDILAAAPFEIFLMVVDYFSTTDYLQSVQVSKKWFSRLVDPRTASSLAAKFGFSSLWRMAVNTPGAQITGNTSPVDKINVSPTKSPTSFYGSSLTQQQGSDGGARLLKAFHSIGPRTSGKYRSVLTKLFCWENEHFFQLECKSPGTTGEETQGDTYYSQFSRPSHTSGSRESVGKNAMYQDGLITWIPDNGAIVILDNLRTKSRKIWQVVLRHTEETTEKLRLMGVSGELVVVRVGRTVHVWNHSSNETSVFDTETELRSCVVEASRFVAITGCSEIHVGRWGRPTVSFRPLTPLEAYEECEQGLDQARHCHKTLNAFLHPSDPDIVYCTMALPVLKRRKDRLQFWVKKVNITNWKFTWWPKIIRSYGGWLHSQDHPDKVFVSTNTAKANNFGLYTVGLVLGRIAHEPAIDTELADRVTMWVTFDIFREEFSTDMWYACGLRRRDSPRLPHFIGSAHFWNRRVVYQPFPGPWEPTRFHLLVANVVGRNSDTDCQKLCGPWRLCEAAFCGVTPTTRPSGENRGKAYAEEYGVSMDIKGPDDTSPAWIDMQDLRQRWARVVGWQSQYLFSQAPHGYATPRMGVCTRVMGDDDFLVMLTDDGFIAWSFHSDLDDPTDHEWELVENGGLGFHGPDPHGHVVNYDLMVLVPGNIKDFPEEVDNDDEPDYTDDESSDDESDSNDQPGNDDAQGGHNTPGNEDGLGNDGETVST
ncbi:hypothetical protein JX265_001474 [Neoarthrinium moseri]|uniref:F-box domain-containing protein n=1 Tax=Neoarthrinium moseri TaxID=1658444 RepID=A0A9P9WVJ3_9PEZI|nr:hypothetical protein JX265_001474 [Neoarthrinium moseri]